MDYLTGCRADADNVFGPRVLGCRESFDFTLLFEQSMLSMIPSVVLLVISVPRLAKLRQDKCLVVLTRLQSLVLAKLSAILCYAATQLALIILNGSSTYDRTRISVAASCLSFLACLDIAILSYLEHYRSLRPSLILNVYLFFSTLFDVAQARTLWLKSGSREIPIVFTVGVSWKAVVLLLEAIEKRSLLKEQYQRYSPEALGGIFNRSVFWWLNSLLLRGSSRVLLQEDLFPLDPQLSSSYATKGLQRMWSSCDKSKRNALLWATLRSSYRSLLMVVLPRLFLVGFTLSQPFLLHRAVSLLSQPDSQQKTNTGRALIGATALIYLGLAFSTAFYKHYTYRALTIIRSGLVDIIYTKTLELHPSAAKDAAAITHMSTDISRIVAGLENSDVLWATPIQVCLAIYILSRQIGLATIAPVAIALGCTVAAFALGKLSRKAQRFWVDAIQVRVAATSSLLKNMKEIRMSGLSQRFATEVQNYRIEELERSLAYRRLNAVTNTIGIMPQILGSVTAFIIFSLAPQTKHGNRLDPATAFTTLSLISLLSSPIFMFMFALPQFTASISCYDRIQEYLISNGNTCSRLSNDSDTFSTQRPIDQKTKEVFDAIRLESIGTSRDKSPDDVLITLDNATFSFRAGEKHVLRHVSSSVQKSSLSMLVGHVGSGKSAMLLALLGELHLESGTLRNARGLGIAYCAQEPWLPNLSIRQIIQGESIHDGTWYKSVIHACALTLDLEKFPEGEETVVGGRGSRLSGGQRQRLSLARALYSRKPLILLDDVTSGLDSITEQAVIQRVFGEHGLCRQHRITVLMTTHRTHFMHLMDNIIELKEGEIVNIGPPSLLKYHLKPMMRESAQVNQDEEPPDVNQKKTSSAKDLQLADFARKTGDFSLYYYYFRSMGWSIATGIMAIGAAFTFSSKFPDWWLQEWADAEEQHPGQNQVKYLTVYAALGLTAVALMFGTVWLLMIKAAPRSAVRLHQVLLTTVVSAGFGFFVSTDAGVTLNRFSQDMSMIDVQLPSALLQTVDGAYEVIASAILIALSSKWVAIAYPPILGIVYILQKFYLRTSRQMRFLDLEAKAPLYTNFTETLQGVVTIRAYGWQDEFRRRNQELLDESQKPFYLMYCIQRWLKLMSDLIVTVIAVFVIAVATQLENGTSSGALGVALANIVTFGQSLTYLIQAWTQLETSMGAISRVKGLEAGTPSEHLPRERLIPMESWPSKGEITFANVTANYGSKTISILQNIALHVGPGSKVGICGRTGSGKSSCILSILRLSDLEQGTIRVDGIDIQDLPRETIRRTLTTLSQDPMVLPGSIRSNLEVFGSFPDETLLSVLKDTGLNEVVASRGGLDDTDASTLSSGQQQLLCLARALLRKTQILLLDEATSNVDAETETRILELVRERFQDCTVVAVAHRLRAIVDFDKVVVLEKGRIIEQGDPQELLRSENSRFRKMWESQQD